MHDRPAPGAKSSIMDPSTLRNTRGDPSRTMSTLVAYCGLECGTCPIHLATVDQDPLRQQTARIEIARLCSEKYGISLLPQDVTECDGCTASTGRLFSGCARCAIRACAISRRLASCAFCADLPCEKLTKHIEEYPLARDRLDAVRKTANHPA